MKIYRHKAIALEPMLLKMGENKRMMRGRKRGLFALRGKGRCGGKANS